MSTPSRSVLALGALVVAVLTAGPARAQGQQSPGPVGPGALDPARLPSRPGPGGTGAAPGAPPRDTSARRPPERGTAAVRGRVVALDTGLPLRRARVSLFGSGQPRTSMTDADGTFAFDHLPAGRYQLQASKARYVDTSHGTRRPAGPGRPLDVTEGQAVENLVLALPSAGVITGRVLDDVGDVVPGASVMTMRFRTVNGERQLMPIGQQRVTDDTGTFRLYGLAPGKYYLSARAEEFPRFGGDTIDMAQNGFAPTFYPGTPVAAEAQPIDVVAGVEAFADVQLATARLTTITGIVVNAAGSPATGGIAMVRGTGVSARFMPGGFGGRIKSDGTFSLSGIPPGDYTIVAQASFGEPSMFEPGPRGEHRTAFAPVVATGEPIGGLRLIVQDPIRIPVYVVFEDGTADKPERVFISASTERGMSDSMAAIRDGRLSLEVVPGTYRLSANAAGQPWFAKRLAYRGREVEDDEVELTAEPGGRIDVLFTTRSSSVAGGVTDGGGKPVADYLVVIIPEDAELVRRGGFRRVRVARPDDQGRFKAEHLLPGRYVAAAIPDAPIEDVFDADLLDGVRRAGKALTIPEGGSATVALTLATLP